MNYEAVNNCDKGYFVAVKANRSDLTFEQTLDKHNIDLNDYWILKNSGKTRILKQDEIFNYVGITLFNKEKYSLDFIESWLDKIYNELNITINFVNKPFPPIEIIDKIKIVK